MRPIPILETFRNTGSLLAHEGKKAVWSTCVLSIVSGVLDLIGLSVLLVYLKFFLGIPPAFLASLFAGYPQDTLAALGATILLSFILIKNAITLFTSDHLNRYIFRVSGKLTLQAYRYFLTRPYIEHLTSNTRHTQALINTDIRHTYHSAVQPLVFAIRDACIILMIFALLVLVNPTITAILSTVGALFLILNFQIIKKESHRLALLQKKSAEQSQKWLDYSFKSLIDIQLSGHNAFLPPYEQAIHTQATFLRKSKTTDLLPPAQNELILTLTVIAIVLYLTYSRVTLTDTLPILLLCALAGLRLLNLLTRLSISLKSILVNAPFVERVTQLKKQLADYQASADAHAISDAAGTSTSVFNDTLTLNHVGFHYAHARAISGAGTHPQTPESRAVPTLHDISLTIKQGSFVGIIGQSGSGKTTLMALILHLLDPKTGDILVDGAPLSASNKRAFQQQIGYIPQTPILFAETVLQNITHGSDQPVDIARVHESLKKAQLDERINRLPQGINTPLAGDTLSLSGGEKQRVVLARLFYQKPRLVFLDEATASLDTRTEAEIYKHIIALKEEGCTILSITHRLHTLASADSIFLLDRGKLVAKGDFDTLRQTSALFNQLLTHTHE